MVLTTNGKNENAAGDGPGESQEAIARRKFAVQCGLAEDDPILPLIQANAQLEMKVEQWSTAILELAELARQQNQAMQETSRNSLALTNVLGSSAKDSQQLQQLIARLDSSLAALKQEQGRRAGLGELNQSALQTLLPTLNTLKLDFQRFTSNTERINQNLRIWNVKGFSWCWRFTWIQLVMGAFLMLCIFLTHHHFTSQQADLQNKLLYTQESLQRIERAVGLDPNKFTLEPRQ